MVLPALFYGDSQIYMHKFDLYIHNQLYAIINKYGDSQNYKYNYQSRQKVFHRKVGYLFSLGHMARKFNVMTVISIDSSYVVPLWGGSGYAPIGLAPLCTHPRHPFMPPLISPPLGHVRIRGGIKGWR